MRNLFEKVIALGKFARSRTFAVGLLSAVLAFTVYTVSMKTHAVYIRDGEQVLLKFTMQQDPQEISLDLIPEEWVKSRLRGHSPSP